MSLGLTLPSGGKGQYLFLCTSHSMNIYNMQESLWGPEDAKIGKMWFLLSKKPYLGGGVEGK